MDLEQARFNMVEQQIRPWNVLDPRVLGVLYDTPRHHFVPEGKEELAYADIALPIGHDQVMLEPRLQARILEAINLQKNETVLQVGTGTGYLTALLAKLGASVRSLDIYDEFTQMARKNLDNEGLGNTIVETANVFAAWRTTSQYNVVVFAGSVAEVPEKFKQTVLPNGGRLFAFVGEDSLKEATLLTRISENEWKTELLFETGAPNFIASRVRHFTF